MSDLTFREGRLGDLKAAFDLGELAWDVSRKARGLLAPDHERRPEELRARWTHERPLLEFIAAQPGSFWICEDGGEPVGYIRVSRFGSMDELTELWADPSHAGRGWAGRCSSAAGPSPPPLSWAGSCSRWAPPWT